jgi:hypothetical protein
MKARAFLLISLISGCLIGEQDASLDPDKQDDPGVVEPPACDRYGAIPHFVPGPRPGQSCHVAEPLCVTENARHSLGSSRGAELPERESPY